jgi:nucleoside-triphosphatase THEP1
MRWDEALKPRALIIHGPIGCGKTRRALELAEIAGQSGYRVLGIVGLRVIEGGETTGYTGMDLASGERFPLVKLTSLAEGGGWRRLGELKYSFSDAGFERANDILEEAAEALDDETMVVADEYGHIELQGMGIYRGVASVAEALKRGGCLVVLCQTEKVEAVLEMLPEEAVVLLAEADSPDFMDGLRDWFN